MVVLGWFSFRTIFLFSWWCNAFCIAFRLYWFRLLWFRGRLSSSNVYALSLNVFLLALRLIKVWTISRNFCFLASKEFITVCWLRIHHFFYLINYFFLRISLVDARWFWKDISRWEQFVIELVRSSLTTVSGPLKCLGCFAATSPSRWLKPRCCSLWWQLSRRVLSVPSKGVSAEVAAWRAIAVGRSRWILAPAVQWKWTAAVEEVVREAGQHFCGQLVPAAFL